MIIRTKIRSLKAACLLALLLITAKPTVAYAHDGDISFSITTEGEPLYYDDLYTSLTNLPKGIKNYLSLNNLNVVILDDINGAEAIYEDITGLKFKGITGFVDVDSSTIYVESSKDANYYKKFNDINKEYDVDTFNYLVINDTLIHELGHFFDLAYDFKLSKSLEFGEIYYAEVNSFINTTEFKVDNLGVGENIRSANEYFATAYASYIKYPEELKELCPRTYEYIDNYMTKLNNEYMPKKEINTEYTRIRKPR